MSKHFIKINLLLLIFLILPQFVQADEWEIDKIKFKNVHFEGEEDLEDIIQSDEGDDFELRIVKLDKILLSNYYRKNGFLDIEVQDSIYFKKRKNEVNIVYKLMEGQRYYFGGVRLKGNKEITNQEIQGAFSELEKNTPFNESLISTAVKGVENIYYNSGKPYMESSINYMYEQDSLIFVLLDIKENQTVYINKIRYSGLKMVKKFLIRRELEIHKGEKYNRQKIEESQKNMYSTGLFKYVRFEMEPIENQSGLADLKIMVQENDPRWIGVHFGVAHEQEMYYGNKLEVTLQGGHRNLYGNARSFSLQITPSFMYDFDEARIHNPDNTIAFRFVEPWILNTRTPGVFNLAYKQYRPINSGNFDLWKSTLDISKGIGKSIKFTTTLSGKFVDLIDKSAANDSLFQTVAQIDKSTIYAVTFYLKRDTRENLFNPHNSTFSDFSMAFSYTSGDDTDGKKVSNSYIVTNGSWQLYLPWRPKVKHFKRGNFTLAFRLKSGAIIEPYGRGIIPINDLFYAGGATTVRGYSEQLLGTAADTSASGKITKAAGGKLLMLSNVEARIPLFWLFVAEFFVDGGYVWPELSSLDFKDYKFSTGLGLALITPLGPVRVDYGYKLNPVRQDPSRDAFHLGIYFAF